MTPDRKVGGEPCPSIYNHTGEPYMGGRVVIYNLSERRLIRMQAGKIMPEGDAIKDLSPHGGILKRNIGKGWSLSEVSQTEMSLTYTEGRRDLLFESVWTFEGGQIAVYPPEKGALLIGGESCAYIPVRRKRDRVGGILIVPLAVLSDNPVRIMVNKFVV